MLSLSLDPPLLESSTTSPPPSPPLPVTPTMENAASSSSSSHESPSDLPLPQSTSRNSIFSSQWGSSPEGKLAPPRPLPLLPLKLEGLDDGGFRAGGSTWSSSNSRRASSSSSSTMAMGSPGEVSSSSGYGGGGSSCSTSPNFPGLAESASTHFHPNSSFPSSTSPSFFSSSASPKPTPTPTPYRQGHQKQSSTSSSISSKTSSFFDTPTPSATPPPPDSSLNSSSSANSVHPPPHIFQQLEHLPYSPTRNSHFASLQQLKPSSPKLYSSPNGPSSPLSPIPRHALPPPQQQPSPSSPSSFASTSLPPPPPPPPRSLRLNPTEPYLLGRGLRASVYLSSIKGKEREWTLAATKIPLQDDGIEGRESLVREAEVLTWLGAKREGIVGFLGLVDLDAAKVRVVKRVGEGGGRRGVFETYTFDPPSSSSLGSLVGASERIPTQPVLLLEYCAYGTIDTFVKTHPELVTEEVWTRWVGVLGSAGEWLEERGVVHRDIKPMNILLTSTLLPLLTDFGSSLLPLRTPSSTSSTSNPSIPHYQTTGTTPYSSPEMLLHPETVSFPSDVFSLGASLYVALSGKEPFKGVSGNREMVFWVGKGGFWEWEERRRGAVWGENAVSGGLGGVKRGGSLREPNHLHTHAHAHPQLQPSTNSNSGLPSSTSLGSSSIANQASGELRRVGSWEVLKPRAAGGGSGSVADGWWRGNSSGTDGEYTSPNPSSRLRASLEDSLLVPADEGELELDATMAGSLPSSPSPKTKSAKPILEPLSLHHQQPPSSQPPLPRLHLPTNPPSSEFDHNEEPLEGLPMFFPSSTRENPQQVSDSARRLLKRMLDPDPRRRGTMRGVREWAEGRGWRREG